MHRTKMSLWVTLGVIILGFFLELGVTITLPADSWGSTLWFLALQAMVTGTLIVGFNGATDKRHMKSFFQNVVWFLWGVLAVFYAYNWFLLFWG